MGWDPSVMGKFAATSHKRLINQLRNDLRAETPAPRSPASVRKPDSTNRTSAQPSASGQGQEKKPEQRKQSPSPSFRERLNAIDMR